MQIFKDACAALGWAPSMEEEEELWCLLALASSQQGKMCLGGLAPAVLGR